jgi:hypothetical protein
VTPDQLAGPALAAVIIFAALVACHGIREHGWLGADLARRGAHDARWRARPAWYRYGTTAAACWGAGLAAVGFVLWPLPALLAAVAGLVLLAVLVFRRIPEGR